MPVMCVEEVYILLSVTKFMRGSPFSLGFSMLVVLHRLEGSAENRRDSSCRGGD